MLTPPLRMYICQLNYQSLFTGYRRFTYKIACVQNNLTFAIKRSDFANCIVCISCLYGYFFLQNFLYDNSTFHLFRRFPVTTFLRCWCQGLLFYVCKGRWLYNYTILVYSIAW